MPNNFFSYSENGAEFHDTAERAKAEVERHLSDYRDDAPEGWADEVEDLCWGAVMGRVVATATRERCPDPDCDGECGNDVHHSRDYDTEVDYELIDVSSDGAVGETMEFLRAELAAVKAERDRYLTRACVAEAKVAKVREVVAPWAVTDCHGAGMILMTDNSWQAQVAAAILTAIGGKP